MRKYYNIPDNYDLWESHDREQRRSLEQLPVCDICDERIQEDYYYHINDEYICPDCLEHFKKRIY